LEWKGEKENGIENCTEMGISQLEKDVKRFPVSYFHSFIKTVEYALLSQGVSQGPYRVSKRIPKKTYEQ
jgi:hypothetical protein